MAKALLSKSSEFKIAPPSSHHHRRPVVVILVDILVRTIVYKPASSIGGKWYAILHSCDEILEWFISVYKRVAPVAVVGKRPTHGIIYKGPPKGHQINLAFL